MKGILGQIGGVLNAAIAGALGGALVGIGESVVVTWTSASAEEYWLFLFGAVAYGVIGAGLGVGAALLWLAISRGRASAARLGQVGMAAGVALPTLIVGRYHVAQRVFDEGMVLLSASGLLAHALLLLGALVAAGLGLVVVSLCRRLGGGLGVPAALAALLAVATLIGVTTDRSEKPAMARSVSGAATGKPNVILVVADTLRADAVEWALQEEDGPTGFKRLAADGVVFDRAYAQASWTRPSVASILTAQYPSVHGTMRKMDFLPNGADTVAEVFKRQGYWTAAVTTNINVAPIFNFQQGFDEFSYLEPGFYFGATDSATKLAVYKGLRVAREKVSKKMWVANYYQDAKTVDEHVAAWLGSKPPEPFFLLVHYMDPHDPYFEMPYNGDGVARVSTPNPGPERVEELHGLYRQGVRYLDGYLQELIGRLEETGLYDKTVIALTADHGEEFFEHGGWWHGTSLYEEQLHVPLIVKRADEPEPGRRRSDWARSIDIAPTLAAAAGVQAPAAFQGIDLFTGTVDDPLFAEEDLEGNRLTAIHQGDWKLITANQDNPRGLAPIELYQLSDDPAEKTNLAAQESGRVSEMLAQLEQLKARIAGHRTRSMGAANPHAADPRS
ncbi:MAG: sulfatase [Candidatus Binatia bacterium]